MLAEITERERELSILFTQAFSLDSDPNIDPRVTSDIAQFLCIRAYAYFELSLKDILKAYIDQAPGDPNVAQFARRQLDQRRSRNLKHPQMLELIGEFNTQWKSKISDSTSSKLGNSLDSVVNNRNIIAHGELTAVFLTIRDVDLYYQDLKQILRLVHNTCV